MKYKSQKIISKILEGASRQTERERETENENERERCVFGGEAF